MGWFEVVGEHATNVTLWRIHIREHASYDGACDGGEVAVKGVGRKMKRIPLTHMPPQRRLCCGYPC